MEPDRNPFIFKRFERSVLSPIIATTWNILLLFILYSLCRVEFLLENYSYFAPSIDDGTIWKLLWGGIVFDTPGIFYTNILYVALMLLPLQWKENRTYYKACMVIFLIVNSISVIANLADSVYFSFTLRRTTADVFGEFSHEGNLLKIFGQEMLNHWYLVIFAAILIWGIIRLYATPRMDIKSEPKVRYYTATTLSLAIGMTICITGIRGGLFNHWVNYLIAMPTSYFAYRLLRERKRFGYALGGLALILLCTAPIVGWRHRDIRPVTLSNANSYVKRPTEIALVLNTPFALIRTIGKSEFTDPHYYDDKRELAKIFDPVKRPAAKPEGMKRKNIVILIVESFGREYIGGFNKEVLGESYKGYTPFTDSLMQHSLTFRYSYCNGRKSIDGMPSILASIPMFVKPFILTPQSLNHLCGIAGHLRKAGWESAFFHGAMTGSMGFDGFANSIGFDRYYGREDFRRDKRFMGDKDFDGYWAIWDEPFLQYYSAKMSEMKQPFVTALFTASSHHPFHIPEEYKGIYKEEELPIHKCIRYTDNALRRFFERSKNEPWFKNTIFVITSDHTNRSNHAEYKSDIGGFCSPIIFYDPSGELKSEMRDAIAQQIDIMPTLLNHLGYPYPYVAFGKDLLNTEDRKTWAVNYLNGTYQYMEDGYMIQFDGKKVTGMYALTDQKMSHNLAGTMKARQDAMEKRLKGIIQSYMDRMTKNQLTDTGK